MSAQDAIAALPPRLALDLAPGTRVSLFPMAPMRVASTGLRWPTDGIDFTPVGPVGTSNEATGPVVLKADGAGMLVIVPRAALVALLDGILGLPPQTPPRV